MSSSSVPSTPAATTTHEIVSAAGEAIADRVSNLGAVIGRTAALELVLGLHGGDQ